MKVQNITAASIETSSGLYVDVTSPDPQTIVLEDIAHALARQPRFSGHTNSDPVWNVATHSIFVHDLVRSAIADLNYGWSTQLVEEMGFSAVLETLSNRDMDTLKCSTACNHILAHAIFHDATEAYLVDIPSPIKKYSTLKDVYAELEGNLNTVIFRKFGIRETRLSSAFVRWADMLALRIEAHALMPSKGQGWNEFYGSALTQSVASLMPTPQGWKYAKREFIDLASMYVGLLKQDLIAPR